MAHFGGQKEGGHAPANVVSKGDYYIMTLGEGVRFGDQRCVWCFFPHIFLIIFEG